MYKPHTIEQYKVYRFLEENFALEHFLLAPLSRFGLILEDKTGEKIALISGILGSLFCLLIFYASSLIYVALVPILLTLGKV